MASATSRLRSHNVTLRGERVVLRPMTEGDWDLLLRWNNDPEVPYYSEGGDITAWDLAEMQKMYRGTSRHAFWFIVQVADRPIGECWLQQMNLPRVTEKLPGLDLRRIDIMIGEKSCWDRGYGTETIRLLARFGFVTERADAILACCVAEYNARSHRAFARAGFVDWAVVEMFESTKSRCEYDLILTRERWEAMDPSPV